MTTPFILYSVMLCVCLLNIFLGVKWKNFPSALGWTMAFFFAIRNGMARGYFEKIVW